MDLHSKFEHIKLPIELLTPENFRGHVAMGTNAGGGLLFGEIAGQSKVAYLDVAILVEQNVSWPVWVEEEGQLASLLGASSSDHSNGSLLQIAITQLASVHVLQAEDHFGCIKSHI